MVTIDAKIKAKIFKALDESYRLDYTIDDLKTKYGLTDNELLPIYNEWLYNQNLIDNR